MTEASHQMTSNPLPKHGPHKPGTVGRAQGSVKVCLQHVQHTFSGSLCRLHAGMVKDRNYVP